MCRRIPPCCRTDGRRQDGSANIGLPDRHAVGIGPSFMAYGHGPGRTDSGISLVVVSRRLFRRLGLLVLLGSRCRPCSGAALVRPHDVVPSSGAPPTARAGDAPRRARRPRRGGAPPAPASPDRVGADEEPGAARGRGGPAERRRRPRPAEEGGAAKAHRQEGAGQEAAPKTPRRSTAKKASAKKAPAKKTPAQKAAEKTPAKKAEPPEPGGDA